MAAHTIDSNRKTTWTTDESSSKWIVTSDGSIDASGTAILNGADFFDNNFIINGDIDASGMSSVGFDIAGLRNDIRIAQSSTVTADVGVHSHDGGLHLHNLGEIDAGTSAVAADSAIHISNDGSMNGVDTLVLNGAATVKNGQSGVITASGIAIQTDGNDPRTQTIENHGLIKGTTAAIEAGGSGLDLVNDGTIKGDIHFGDGRTNTFDSNGGVVKGNIYGGTQHNIFHLDKGDVTGTVFGGESANDYYVTTRDITISGHGTVHSTVSYKLGGNLNWLTLEGDGNIKGVGGAHDDILQGNSGDNQLNGGDGADKIWGRFGDDMMTGGDGADVFQFAGKARHADQFDTVTDFQVGVDKIMIMENLADLDTGHFNMDRIVQHGDDAWINYGSRGHMVLQDIDGSTLSMSDFIIDSA